MQACNLSLFVDFTVNVVTVIEVNTSCCISLQHFVTMFFKDVIFCSYF